MSKLYIYIFLSTTEYQHFFLSTITKSIFHSVQSSVSTFIMCDIFFRYAFVECGFFLCFFFSPGHSFLDREKTCNEFAAFILQGILNWKSGTYT